MISLWESWDLNATGAIQNVFVLSTMVKHIFISVPAITGPIYIPGVCSLQQ